MPKARLVMVHRSDTYAGKRVRTRHIRALLRDVLHARRSPPRANPKIVTRPQSAGTFDDTPPSAAEANALTGNYADKDTRLVVGSRPGGLRAYGPDSGHYNLLRAGRNEYVFEDSHYRLSFEADRDAPASALTIAYPHKRPLRLRRVP